MIAYRSATVSEPSSYPCSATKDYAAIVVYRGVDSSSPIDVVTPFTVEGSSDNSDTHFPPAVTTAPGSVVVRTLAHDNLGDSGAQEPAPLTGHTNRAWGTAGGPYADDTFGGVWDMGATPDSSLSPGVYPSPSGFYHVVSGFGTTMFTMSLTLHASGSPFRPSLRNAL